MEIILSCGYLGEIKSLKQYHTRRKKLTMYLRFGGRGGNRRTLDTDQLDIGILQYKRGTLGELDIALEQHAGRCHPDIFFQLFADECAARFNDKAFAATHRQRHAFDVPCRFKKMRRCIHMRTRVDTGADDRGTAFVAEVHIRQLFQHRDGITRICVIPAPRNTS